MLEVSVATMTLEFFIHLSSAYYLAKNERPLNDFPNLIELQEKNGVRDIGKVDLTDKKCSEFIHILPMLSEKN